MVMPFFKYTAKNAGCEIPAATSDEVFFAFAGAADQ
jgi:hypothetical protein